MSVLLRGRMIIADFLVLLASTSPLLVRGFESIDVLV